MKPRILYLSYDGMTDSLGQSQVLPYLCGLSREGFEIELISFEKPDKFLSGREAIFNLCENNNIKWHPLSYTKRPPVLSTLYDLFRLRRKALELHHKNPFQLVHCRSYIPGIVGRMLKFKLNIPFLFDMRGFWVDERIEGKIWNRKNPLFNFIYHSLKKTERKLFIDASQIISLTNAAIPEINKIRERNTPIIEVIPCCVDESHFDFNKITGNTSSSIKSKLGFNADDFILTYLGSISTWYMPDKMLDFFKVLKSKNQNAKFLVITHEDPTIIINLANERGIDVKDLVIQSATRKELPEILSICDATIYFITPSFSKIASSPTKKAELLCMGIPTITNDGIGDTTTILESNHAGFICRNFSQEEYIRAIDFIEVAKKNPNEKNRLRSIGERHFSLKSGVASYLKIYRQLLLK
ncbi:MAG: glycosyltransferase [Bacteroidota bacterium]